MSIDIGEGKEWVSRSEAKRPEIYWSIKQDTELYQCALCENFMKPNITVTTYAYEYRADHNKEMRELWSESYNKICMIHFMLLGVNRGRE